jgi:hypothetical protein
MLQMFRASSLGLQIQQRLLVPTAELNREHDAYIENPGALVGVTMGDARRIADHPPPAGSRPVGYVHTHPVSPQVLPPTVTTPCNDWLDSSVYPVQMMVETGPRRVWGLISPNLPFPLGLMTVSGSLNELDPASPQARVVYALR